MEVIQWLWMVWNHTKHNNDFAFKNQNVVDCTKLISKWFFVLKRDPLRATICWLIFPIHTKWIDWLRALAIPFNRGHTWQLAMHEPFNLADGSFFGVLQHQRVTYCYPYPNCSKLGWPSIRRFIELPSVFKIWAELLQTLNG